MGKEQPQSYYDQVYKASPIKSWRDYKAPRKRLFRAAAEMIGKSPLMMDLGCGPGLFAQFLDEEFHDNVELYNGFDFSRYALRHARNLLLGDNRFQFHLANLMQMEYSDEVIMPPGAVFIIMETLEHLEDDMHVLSLVPDGSTVVVSVPSFDDPGHVRIFPTWEHVSARYSEHLEISEHQQVCKWFLFKGIKKAHEDETKKI